jgi:hypothetical protein
MAVLPRQDQAGRLHHPDPRARGAAHLRTVALRPPLSRTRLRLARFWLARFWLAWLRFARFWLPRLRLARFWLPRLRLSRFLLHGDHLLSTCRRSSLPAITAVFAGRSPRASEIPPLSPFSPGCCGSVLPLRFTPHTSVHNLFHPARPRAGGGFALGEHGVGWVERATTRARNCRRHPRSRRISDQSDGEAPLSGGGRGRVS